MRMSTRLVGLLCAFFVASSVAAQSAPPASQERTSFAALIEHAKVVHGDLGVRAAQFLAEHAPTKDGSLELSLLKDNLDYALKARAMFAFASGVEEELFLNDVVPYAVLDETRESWRPKFFKLSSEIVKGAKTALEAAQRLNRDLFNEISVHYNTGRKRPNQSPEESIAQGRATCTGLTVILVDACRSVGIPARAVGVANWHDNRGNHTWVEVHDGERWRFLGADEYDASGVDRGWFVGDAEKATPGDREHAVWASSFAQIDPDAWFPMVWNRGDHSVGAVDVTARYLASDEATENRGDVPAGMEAVRVRVWDQRGGTRLVAEVEVLGEGGDLVVSGTTLAGRADLNDMLTLVVPQDGQITVRVRLGSGSGVSRFAHLPMGEERASTLDLYWDQLGLDREAAEELVRAVAVERATAVAEAAASEVEAKAFVFGKHSLRLLEKTFGDAPAGERSLWISMHGGGGAPANVNDGQWRNQIRLYTLDEGIYVAPRAPTNTWNLWHEGHIDALFGRLIDTYVATRGVDPNKVYLLGYSAGGDGVYQLAPRMADRFAAASMMAGHPNDASPLGLRNLPFAIFMGGEDAAYDRNKIAAQWGDKLKALRKKDRKGYEHRVTIYKGLGHWMNGKDAEALPWMAKKTRTSWPQRVVWHQSSRTHERFYWLAVARADQKGGATVIATKRGQTIELESEDLRAITLRLRDGFVDLDRELVVKAGNKVVYRGIVPRTEAAIRRSLEQRFDSASAATAELRVSW